MQDFTSPDHNPARSRPAALALSGEALFFQKVYLFMGLGLLITAAVAFYLVLARPNLIVYILSNSTLWIGLILAELALVWLFSLRAAHASIPAAAAMLLVYAVLNGVTFAVIVSLYQPLVVGQAFMAAALTFGAMSVYGLVTKKSLQKWGGFLYMALWGIIFALLINFTVAWIWQAHSTMVNLVICGLAVVVFAMLTAYRHQELRVMYAAAEEEGGDAEVLTRLALAGALSLYLAFVTLFLYLLRIIGYFNRS